MFGPRTKRNFLHSRLFLSDELGSERYTITFVEERYSANNMAAAHRVGLEGIQLALGCRSVVPCLK